MTEEKKTAENSSASGKNEPKKKFPLVQTAVAAAGVALTGFIVWGLYLVMHPVQPPLQGQIEATTVDVAAQIPGRIQTLAVKEGEQVAAGAVIAELSIPEIEAKVRQARAVSAARAAQANLAEEGARPQEIAAAHAMYDRAAAAEELAQKTYDRIARLYKEGFVPAQRLDEVTANLKAAQKAAVAARQQWEIAQTGARSQEKAAANALAAQAESGLAEAESYAAEAKITAPMSGEVSRVLLHAGEVAPQGFPVVTLVDLSDQWAAFNLREDLMTGLKIGDTLKVKIPAVGGKPRDFTVYFINAKSDYATWRSTRENSGYDLKTFEIRARPAEPVEGLRPGMTALIER